MFDAITNTPCGARRTASRILALTVGLLALTGCGDTASNDAPLRASEPDIPPAERADAAARAFVERVGAQDIRAITWNWKNGRPPDACYAHWRAETAANRDTRDLCQQWAEDLSALFASYGVEAEPVVFASDWFRTFRDDESYYMRQYLSWEEGNAQHPDCSRLQSSENWDPKVVSARMGVVGCPDRDK